MIMNHDHNFLRRHHLSVIIFVIIIIAITKAMMMMPMMMMMKTSPGVFNDRLHLKLWIRRILSAQVPSCLE